MTSIHAIVLGIVEGLTEYLPVSSTGHLLLVEKLLGIGGSKAAQDAYAVCIQLGAILAVVSLYSERVKQIFRGIVGKDTVGRKLVLNLIIAFIPAVIIGLLFEDSIKKYLFGLWPISIAWVVGGLAIFIVSKKYSVDRKGCSLEEITPKQALTVGLAQCIAMWPGVSRSLATIVGGMLAGVSMIAAVEFSFLLGLVTLGSATLYDAHKYGHLMIATYGWVSPLIGLIASYLSAIVAVKWMVSYISKRGMNVFGYYRVAIGCIVAILLLVKVL